MNHEVERSRSPSARRVLIRASAGAGKTYELSTQYLSALRDDPPDRILATTFTRKAAGEILERVLMRLADAALDDGRRGELARSLGLGQVSVDECRSQLQRFVRALHRVRIGTLDSFFAQVARAFALELGIPPSWRIADEAVENELRRRAIQQVVEAGGVSDICRLMHLLAKGEARRGVSRLLLTAVEELYDVYRTSQEDAWTLTQPPGLLSSERLDEAIEELRRHPLPDLKSWRDARDADVQAALGQDWIGFVSNGLAAKVADGESTYRGKPIPTSLADIYRRLIRHGSALETQILTHQAAAARDLLRRFDEAFDEHKRQAGVLTFDDVTHRIADLLDAAGPSRLAYRLDGRIDHLLLDEFQDTSARQWQVLRHLALSLAENGRSTFFCVGDVKQAIYGWRGGVAELFESVTRQVPGVRAEGRSHSYRSAQPIIDVVNQVFTGVRTYPDAGDDAETLTAFADSFPRHETHRAELAGHVRLQAGDAPEEGESDQEAVLRFAAEQVATLAAWLPPENSIGVLTRTNDSAGRMIHALRARGVAASQEGGQPVTDSAAVQVVLSALKFADHPGDSIARHHVAHSRLGSVLELTPDADADTAHHIARQLREELLQQGYGNVIYGWLFALLPDCNERELLRLRQLVALADEYQPVASLRPSDFVQFASTRGVEDSRSAAVRVMTVHKSKGLEFDLVVLPELEQRCFRPPQVATLLNPEDPSASPRLVTRPGNAALRRLLPREHARAVRQTRDRLVRESLCLLYVAMTRAARGLHMYVAPRSHFRLCPARLLRHSLGTADAAEPGEVLFEHGDPRWFQTAQPHRPPAPSEPVEEAPSTIRLAPPDPTRDRGLEVVAPSRHDEARQLVTMGHVLAAERRRALAEGTLIHAWLERIEWLDDGGPSDDELRLLARRLRPAGIDVNGTLRSFRRMIRAAPVDSLLRRSAYAAVDRLPFAPDVAARLLHAAAQPCVRNERPIVLSEEELLLSGTVDRLVLLKSGDRVLAADVIDYKTDAVDAEQAESLVERYGEQLRIYADAVIRMYELPPECVSARIVALKAGRVVSASAT